MTAPVAPGDVLLGKYRVERILGQGGMGIVVEARHIELGEPFAIKFLLPRAAEHPQAMERFVREARAAAKLKGEHVAKVHDVGRLPDGLPYMVLEYLAGRDLRQTLRERGPLPVGEAVTYLLQVCEAIAEAHAHGIVHRDIKPANLFLTRRVNGTPCVKVLDFGVSRQTEPEDPEQHGLTVTGMLLGSPRYMSPEQMTRTKEADARSDIWSLGCVLYELLTGTVPFRADVLTELVAKLLQEEPDPPRAHRADIPPAVEAVVMRCLVKRKEDRFQTVEQLAEALRNAMTQPALAPVPLAPAAAPPAPAAAPPAPFPVQPPLPPGPAHDPVHGGGLHWNAPVPPRASTPSYHNPEATVVLPDAGPMAAQTGPGPLANTAPGWGATSSGAKMPPSPLPKKRAGLVPGAVIGLVALLGGGAWLAIRNGSSAPANETSSIASQSAPAAETPVSPAPPPAPAAPSAALPAPEPLPSAAPPAETVAATGPGHKPEPTLVTKTKPPLPSATPVSHPQPTATATPAATPTASTKRRGSMY